MIMSVSLSYFFKAVKLNAYEHAPYISLLLIWCLPVQIIELYLTLNLYSFCRGLVKITYKGHILSTGVVVKCQNGKSLKKKFMP